MERFFGEIISRDSFPRDSFPRVSFKIFCGEFLSNDCLERLFGEILSRDSFERSFQEILPRAFLRDSFETFLCLRDFFCTGIQNENVFESIVYLLQVLLQLSLAPNPWGIPL